MEERVSQGRGGEKEGEEDESEGEGERGLRFHPIPADPIFLSPVKWQSADRWLLAVTLRLLMRHFSEAPSRAMLGVPGALRSYLFFKGARRLVEKWCAIARECGLGSGC